MMTYKVAGARVHAALLGCGGRALSEHIPSFIRDVPRTAVLGLCDPDPHAVQRARQAFEQAGAPVPSVFSHEDELLAGLGSRLDALVIASPPAVHHRQVDTALEHRIDILVEKPAVMNHAEAESLLKRNIHGNQVVVAFQGASSRPRAFLRDFLGAPGCVPSSVQGAIWQDWRRLHADTWRQCSAENDGGFIYDTGLHLLHAVIDLVGPMALVNGHVASGPHGQKLQAGLTAVSVTGVLVNLSMNGDVPSATAGSGVRIFTNRGIIETDVWGEYARVHGADGKIRTLYNSGGMRLWQRFVEHRANHDGGMCDLDTWLDVQRFYDALMESSRQGGTAVPASS